LAFAGFNDEIANDVGPHDAAHRQGNPRQDARPGDGAGKIGTPLDRRSNGLGAAHLEGQADGRKRFPDLAADEAADRAEGRLQHGLTEEVDGCGRLSYASLDDDEEDAVPNPYQRAQKDATPLTLA